MTPVDRVTVTDTEITDTDTERGRDSVRDRMQKRNAHNEGPDVLVEASQGELLAEDQVDLGAEPAKNAGEFQGDVPAADDDDAAGPFREVEGLVGGDPELLARDVGDGGAPAGGDEDVLRSVLLAADVDGVGVDDRAAALDELRGRGARGLVCRDKKKNRRRGVSCVRRPTAALRVEGLTDQDGGLSGWVDGFLSVARGATRGRAWTPALVRMRWYTPLRRWISLFFAAICSGGERRALETEDRFVRERVSSHRPTAKCG